MPAFEIVLLVGGFALNLLGLCGAILYATHRISTAIEGRLTRVETKVSGLQGTLSRVVDHLLSRPQPSQASRTHT